MKNLSIREFAFFSAVATFHEFFFWLTKKGWQKTYICQLKKIITLVYNINYYLIVLIDRVPQCLYLQCCSYKQPNNSLSICSLKKKNFSWHKIDNFELYAWCKDAKMYNTKKTPDLVLINSVLWDYLFYYLSLVSQHTFK